MSNLQQEIEALAAEYEAIAGSAVLGARVARELRAILALVEQERAALREALQQIHDLCWGERGLMSTSISSTAAADHAKAHRIADAALASMKEADRGWRKEFQHGEANG